MTPSLPLRPTFAINDFVSAIRTIAIVVSTIFVAACGSCGEGDLEVVNNQVDGGFVVDGGTLVMPDVDATSVPQDPDMGGPPPPVDMGTTEPDMEIVDPGPIPNEGWVGGPCESVVDCPYDDAVCLDDGFPGGQCSLACDRVCPDQDGMNSVTFCVDVNGSGRCVSQCDFELYPDVGCRDGYSCRIEGRFAEPGTQRAVCRPGDAPNPNATTACLRALDEAGVIWAPWAYSTQYDGGLACTIDDPIRVTSPINGVSYRYYNQDTPGTMSMACELALALVDLGDLLAEYELTDVLHVGTFNCRKIAGSNSLSQHGLGLAIDIWAFEDAAGQDYILERDWEHGTTNPQGQKARVLYEVGQKMYDRNIFNIVLTPNYNAAHDNHFHVDLKEGGDFIGLQLGPDRYFGDDATMWERHCGND